MRRHNRLIWIVGVILLLCIISFFREDGIANWGQANLQVAKPIINVVTDKMLQEQIKEDSFPMEYCFEIHNYDGDEVNQADFEYRIYLEDSVSNFPVKYCLIEIQNNQEVPLENGYSTTLILPKNEKVNRKFKIVLNWKELDGQLAEEMKIRLKILAIQGKDKG